MSENYKLQQLRQEYKLATTDIDRELIKARAELIKLAMKENQDLVIVDTLLK